MFNCEQNEAKQWIYILEALRRWSHIHIAKKNVDFHLNTVYVYNWPSLMFDSSSKSLSFDRAHMERFMDTPWKGIFMMPCHMRWFANRSPPAIHHNIERIQCKNTSLNANSHCSGLYNINIRSDPFMQKRSDRKWHVNKCVVWSPKIKSNFGFNFWLLRLIQDITEHSEWPPVSA